VVVSFGDTALDVADLVLLGMLRGAWLELEHGTCTGLARDSAEACQIDADELRRAASAFRHARGLISARDFVAWLEERSLGVADLSVFLRRRLLLERAGAGVHPAALSEDLGSENLIQFERVLWVDAVCGGVLERLASAGGDLLTAADLAGVFPADGLAGSLQAALAMVRSSRLEALASLPEPDVERRLRSLFGLQGALERLRGEACDAVALARCVAGHRLDWLRVRGSELVFTSERAAREARLMIRDDGLAPDIVAERSRPGPLITRTDRELLVGDSASEIATALAVAAPGDVVGPWREGDGWRVLLVGVKEPPSVEDPIVRELAIAEGVRELLDRHGAGRLRRGQPV